MPSQLKDEPLAAWQPTADIIAEQDSVAIDLEPNAMEMSSDAAADENEEEPDVMPDGDSTAADMEPSASLESFSAADNEPASSSATPTWTSRAALGGETSRAWLLLARLGDALLHLAPFAQLRPPSRALREMPAEAGSETFSRWPRRRLTRCSTCSRSGRLTSHR